MTSEGIVREICDRFFISRYDLRKGLYEYEIEMYSNALNITEATLLCAIRECKTKKYNYKKNKKQESSKLNTCPTKNNY